MRETPNPPERDADDETYEPATRRPAEPATPRTGTRRRSSSETPTRVTGGFRPPPAPPPVSPYGRGQAQPSGPKRGKARTRKDSGLYLPWWSMLLMLVLVAGLAVGALLVVNSVGGQAPPGGRTPIFIVITATFTIGPPASATPIPQPPTLTAPPPLPTIPPSVTLPPGNFTIGAMVQVIGTGTNGLNVRSGPSTQFSVKFLGQDGQKYTLVEGPQQADGEEWWHIQDPNNPSNDGWAVRRFLTVVQP